MVASTYQTRWEAVGIRDFVRVLDRSTVTNLSSAFQGNREGRLGVDDTLRERFRPQIELRVSFQVRLVLLELVRVGVLNSTTLAKTCLLGSSPP